MPGHRAALIGILGRRYPGADHITMPTTTRDLITAEIPVAGGKLGTVRVTIDDAMPDGTWQLEDAGNTLLIGGLILPDVTTTSAKIG